MLFHSAYLCSLVLCFKLCFERSMFCMYFFSLNFDSWKVSIVKTNCSVSFFYWFQGILKIKTCVKCFQKVKNKIKRSLIFFSYLLFPSLSYVLKGDCYTYLVFHNQTIAKKKSRSKIHTKFVLLGNCFLVVMLQVCKSRV